MVPDESLAVVDVLLEVKSALILFAIRADGHGLLRRLGSRSVSNTHRAAASKDGWYVCAKIQVGSMALRVVPATEDRITGDYADSMQVYSTIKDLFHRMGITSYVTKIEEWWFDTTLSVQTRGNMRSFGTSRVIGQLRDSLTYIPIRVPNARTALRELPIRNYSQYTFIDMGSGKGRMLFLAAEYPFRRIQGVEFVTELHEQACDNIRRYKNRRQKCVDIESINANAAEFEFQSDSLVICIFNPFGPDVLSRVLTNLERSIERHPRHVIILLVYPVLSHLVAGMQMMSLYKQTRRYHIYQT